MVWATARHRTSSGGRYRTVTMIGWATGASKQDGDAVPGAAGDLGGGHPSSATTGPPRDAGRTGGGPAATCTGRGSGLACFGPDLVAAGALEDAAPGGLEDPPVRGGAAEPVVGARQAARIRRERG